MSNQDQVSRKQREFKGANNEKALNLLHERARKAYSQRSRPLAAKSTSSTPSQKFVSGLRVVRDRMA